VGLVNVVTYRAMKKFDKKTPQNEQKNKGFAFLEYDSLESATTAKKELSLSTFKLWDCDLIVDWANPLEDPDSNLMVLVSL
jgi:RNA recognition motif-containing protein